MQKTEHYQLPHWEQDDPIKMDDFNELTQKVDAALKSGADTAASGLSAETSARQSADTAIENALISAMGTHGYNCRAVMGSYTGTGKSGASNPTTIVTDFTPLVLVLATDGDTYIRIRQSDQTYADHDFTGGNATNQITWSTNGISWYNTVTSSANERQANERGIEYHYLVFGYDAIVNE